MLNIIVMIPLIGMWVVGASEGNKKLRIQGIVSSIIMLVIYGMMWVEHNSNNSYFEQIEGSERYYPGTLGIDSISLYMVGITIILIPVCILSTWDQVKEDVKLYIVLWLGLETILILVFVSLDIIIFYIAFETSLIPMYLIIGIYGSRERKIYAAYQFFLITLLGSLVMLMGIIMLYSQIGVTDYQIITISEISKEREYILWIALFISFAVKTPLVPVHLWLPEAHSEANVAGSIILAGVLLKLAGYGLIRYSLSLLREGSIYYQPLVYSLSIVSIIYSSLATLRQIDMKKIIAYSSIGHMGIVLLGIFSYSIEGIEGSIILMIGHGLVSPGLFIIVTILYDRYHSRIIKYYRGVVGTSPLLGIIFLIYTLANMGVPLTSNFVGELLCFMGAFEANPIATIIGSTGIILGGGYSIWFYNRITFGERSVYIRGGGDINRREWAQLWPLLILIMIIGVYPNVIIETLHIAVSKVLYAG